MKKFLALILALAMMLSLSACGNKDTGNAGDGEETWEPTKPITILAPAGAGGGLDTAARTVAKIANNEGLVSQGIGVENKPGGGQVTGTVEFAGKYEKDNHALLLVSTPFILNYIKADGNSPIGPDDVYPICELQSDYGVIAVRADSPYNTLGELFDAIKANPESVQFCGGGAPGTWDHLQCMMVADAAGVDLSTLKYNTYDGGGEALTALLGGHASAMTSDVSSVKEYLKAGQVKVLGISSAERLSDDEIMKDVPTYTEEGYAVTTSNWRGLFAGKGMSDAAKTYWCDVLGQLCATDAYNEELEKMGLQNTYKDAADFYEALMAEMELYKEVYTKLGLALK